MDRNFASIQYFLGNETYLLSIPKPQFKREVQPHSVLELQNIHTEALHFFSPDRPWIARASVALDSFSNDYRRLCSLTRMVILGVMCAILDSSNQTKWSALRNAEWASNLGKPAHQAAVNLAILGQKQPDISVPRIGLNRVNNGLKRGFVKK